MLTANDTRPRRRPSLAAQTAFYALATVLVLTAIELAVLGPERPRDVAILLLPLFVCTALTYVITKRITERRVGGLTEVYRCFERGAIDGEIPFPADPEFAEAHELFVRLARELYGAKRELERRDAERRRLFSDVVHEIGTPVSSLLGLAEAFERPSLVATEEQRSRLARAFLHESERLARFLEELRDLAHLDDPAMVLRREPVALDALVRDAVERLNAIPGAAEVDVEVEPASVHADPARLEQVVENLVTNARRYARSAAPIRVRVSREGERARLVVEDGGPGVDEADLGKLGERMRRLDGSRTRETGGSGLGLSIVTAIAQRHDGAIRFGRSELGGLAVAIELPLSEPAPPPRAASSPRTPPASPGASR